MQQNRQDNSRKIVVGTGIVLIAFGVPHFVDDFLYGIPAEFGLTNPQAQVLGGVFFSLLVLFLILAERGLRSGYYATFGIGVFLAAAIVLRHLEGVLAPEPYWGGFVSEVSIIGLLISCIVLVAASLRALYVSRNAKTDALERNDQIDEVSGVYLLLLGTRLWPVILIAVLRPVSGWLIAGVALIGTGAFMVSMYSGVLRQAYLASEYSENPGVEALHLRLNRLGRLSLGLWLAYGLSLIGLLVV